MWCNVALVVHVLIPPFVSIYLPRFMENKYEHLEMIVQQLAATSAKRLTGSLSIQVR